MEHEETIITSEQNLVLRDASNITGVAALIARQSPEKSMPATAKSSLDKENESQPSFQKAAASFWSKKGEDLCIQESLQNNSAANNDQSLQEQAVSVNINDQAGADSIVPVADQGLQGIEQTFPEVKQLSRREQLINLSLQKIGKMQQGSIQANVAKRSQNKDFLQELQEKNSMMKADYNTSIYKITPTQQPETCQPHEGRVEAPLGTWDQRCTRAAEELLLKNPRNWQKRVIDHMLLINENLLIEAPANSGKCVLYSLLAKLSRELVIVVLSSHLHLSEKMKNMKGQIAWASLQANLSPEQRERVLQSVTQRQIQLLFVSPDVFAQESYFYLPDVQVVLLEDGLQVLEYGAVHKQPQLVQLIRKKLRPKSLAIVCPQRLPQFRLTEFKRIFDRQQRDVNLQILRAVDESKDQSLPEIVTYSLQKITFSRDEDKNKALTQLLRNPKLPGAGKGVVLCCENRRSCEEAVAMLNLRGFKAQSVVRGGTTDVQANHQLALFQKGQFDILAITAQGAALHFISVLRVLRTRVHALVFYNVPLSVQEMVSGSAYLSEDSFVHGFLHDQDVQAQRIELASELLSQHKTEVLFYKIFSTPLEQRRQARQSSECEDDLKQSSSVLQIQRATSNEFLRQLDECAGGTFEDAVQTIKVNETCQELEITREVFWRVVSEAVERQWIELITVFPLVAQVRLLNIKEETLAAQSAVIRKIFELNGANLYQKRGAAANSAHRFDVVEVSSALGGEWALQEVMRELRRLANERLLNLEMLEEAVCVRLLTCVDSTQLEASARAIADELQQQQNTRIVEFDVLAIAARLLSSNTIEQVFKHAKLRGNAVNTASTIKNSSRIPFAIDAFVNEYLHSETLATRVRNSTEAAMALKTLFKSQEDVANDPLAYLPLVRTSTQRERSGVLKDVQLLLTESPQLRDYGNVCRNDDESESGCLLAARAKLIVMVLQGMNPRNGSISQWRGNKLWKKYSKFNYFELLEIVQSVLRDEGAASEPAIVKKRKF